MPYPMHQNSTFETEMSHIKKRFEKEVRDKVSTSDASSLRLFMSHDLPQESCFTALPARESGVQGRNGDYYILNGGQKISQDDYHKLDAACRGNRDKFKDHFAKQIQEMYKGSDIKFDFTSLDFGTYNDKQQIRIGCDVTGDGVHKLRQKIHEENRPPLSELNKSRYIKMVKHGVAASSTTACPSP